MKKWVGRTSCARARTWWSLPAAACWEGGGWAGHPFSSCSCSSSPFRQPAASRHFYGRLWFLFLGVGSLFLARGYAVRLKRKLSWYNCTGTTYITDKQLSTGIPPWPLFLPYLAEISACWENRLAVAKVEEGSTTATASGCSFPSSWAGSWFLRKEISPHVNRFPSKIKFLTYSIF